MFQGRVVGRHLNTLRPATSVVEFQRFMGGGGPQTLVELGRRTSGRIQKCCHGPFAKHRLPGAQYHGSYVTAAFRGQAPVSRRPHNLLSKLWESRISRYMQENVDSSRFGPNLHRRLPEPSIVHF